MHEQRKSKYNLRRKQPRESQPQSMTYNPMTPMKVEKKNGKKLNNLISRLTRQTESSGRKKRNPETEAFTKPSNTYSNFSFKPHTAFKKSTKKR